MHERTKVKITRIEKLATRPGFPGRYHRVDFKFFDEGLVDSSFTVWVPGAYPEANVESVARAILWRRLLDMAELAGALRDQELAAEPKKVGGNSRAGRANHTRTGRTPRTPNYPQGAHIQLTRYILRNHDPLPCTDLVTWRAWMETPERWVQDTLLSDPSDNQVRICTVFLGVDVSFGIGPPILFETMVIGGMCDRELYRYHTWGEAKEGHAHIVMQIRRHDKDLANSSAVLKARDLAHRTVQTAEQPAVKELIEAIANDPAR